MSAAEIVAATEAGAVESASAAVVASAAAESAVIAASTLVAQVEANAAETIAEVKSETIDNKERISWQENRIVAMESNLQAILETTRTQGEQITLLLASPLLIPAQVPATLPAESSVVEVGHPAAVAIANEAAANEQKPEAKKRHRLL